MSKILGIGNALVDILVRIDSDKVLEELKLPKGSMQLVDKETSAEVLVKTERFENQMASGGSAANTIHGLANLGVETAFIGTVGEDYHGDFFVRDMVNSKIEPLVSNGEADTGCAISLISPDSERTFATYLGAAIELTENDISEETLKQYDYLHMEGYLVANQKLVEDIVMKAKKSNCKVCLDLASYNVVEANLDFLQKITDEYVDVLFANEEEAKAFTGKEPEAALDEIAKKCEIAVVKVGKSGSYIKKGNDVARVQAILANSIDTTGAGDLFAAGFIHGLTNNLTLEKCGKIGSMLAGKVVEVIGPKMTEPVWKELRENVFKIVQD